MRYALSLPNGGPCADPRTLAEFAALAEDVGFDAVLLEDYLIYQNRVGTPTFDPWVSLAAMATRTRTVRLGTCVTPLSRRRVAKLAAETVTLDHLSGGRVILGVGAGDPWDASLQAFGDRPRAALVDEALEVLVGLWSGEPFSFHGQHLSVDNVTFAPKPVQEPRIPIWIGGQYPKRGPIERAARWDGSCLFKASDYGEGSGMPINWTPQEIRDLRAKLRPGADIVVGGAERSKDWAVDRALIRELADAGATWWSEWVPPVDYETMRAAITRGPLRIAD